jgi:hypothetical protein
VEAEEAAAEPRPRTRALRSAEWAPGQVPDAPGRNIGKDPPGFKLPFTPAGEAAWKHNVTATVDPESLCIIGGIPRHNASARPFTILQTKNYVAFLYLSPTTA